MKFSRFQEKAHLSLHTLENLEKCKNNTELFRHVKLLDITHLTIHIFFNYLFIHNYGLRPS